MVFVLAADRPFEAPVREPFQACALVQPFVLRIGRVGKSRNVERHLFDRDVLLTVGPELRDYRRNSLAGIQFAFADQNPRRRRHDRLGARKYRVERLVGGGLVLSTLLRASDGAHRAYFSVACDRDLRRGQQAVVDFALCAFEKRLDLFRIETYFTRTFCKMTLRRHCRISLLLNSRFRDITHERRFVIRKRRASYPPPSSTLLAPAASRDCVRFP